MADALEGVVGAVVRRVVAGAAEGGAHPVANGALQPLGQGLDHAPVVHLVGAPVEAAGLAECLALGDQRVCMKKGNMLVRTCC